MGIPKSVEQAREYSNNINNVDATLMPQNEQNLAIRYALHDIAKQTGEAPAFNFDYSPVDYDDTLSSEIYKPYVNPLQDALGMLLNAVPSVGAAMLSFPTIMASGGISLLNDALERITGDDYDDPKVQAEKKNWFYDPAARGSIEWTNSVNDFFDSWKYKPSDKAQEKLDVTNFWATANPNNVAANIGNGIGSVIAFIGTIALTKGMSGGGSVKLFQGLSNISKAEVLGSYMYMNNEVYNEFRNNAKIDDLTAAKLSSLVSLPIALSEYVGLSALGKVMTKPMVKNAIKDGVEEAIASYGTKGLTKELYQDFTAKAIQGIGNRMTTAALKGAEGAVIEGVQEYGQGKMQQAAEALYDKIANEKVFGTELFDKQALKDDINNAFWGGAIGGLLGMGGGMINSKEMQESVFHYIGINLQKNRPAKIDGVKKFITQLGENGKITPEQTEQGLKMVDEMVAVHKEAMPLSLTDIDARYQAYEFIQARNKIQADLLALDEKPVDPTLAKADSELRTIMEQSAEAYDEAIALIAKTKGQISESELGKKLFEIGTQFNKVEAPKEEVKTDITPIENTEELTTETKVEDKKAALERRRQKELNGQYGAGFRLEKRTENTNEQLTDRNVGSIEKAIQQGIQQGKSASEILGILNALGFIPANIGNGTEALRNYLQSRIDGSNITYQQVHANGILTEINAKYDAEIAALEGKKEEVKVDLAKNDEMLKKAEKALKATITKIEQLKTQPLGAKESQAARDEKIANFEERKKQIETKIGELNAIREAETRVEGVEETGAVVETADTGVGAEEVVEKQIDYNTPIQVNVDVDEKGILSDTKLGIVNKIKEAITPLGVKYKKVVASNKGNRYFVVTKDDKMFEIGRLVANEGKPFPLKLNNKEWVEHAKSIEKTIKEKENKQEVQQKEKAAKLASEYVGESVYYKGKKGVIEKEGDKYVITTDETTYEFNENDFSLEDEKVVLANKKEKSKKTYKVDVVDEKTAIVDGFEYSIVYDKKGNAVALTSKTRTIRTEQALIDTDIQIAKLPTTAAEYEVINEQLVSEGYAFNEIEAVDNMLAQNMTDRIANLLDNGFEGVEDIDLLQLELFIENAVNSIDKNFSGLQYAEDIKTQLIEIQKIADNEYDNRFKEKSTESNQEAAASKVKVTPDEVVAEVKVEPDVNEVGQDVQEDVQVEGESDTVNDTVSDAVNEEAELKEPIEEKPTEAEEDKQGFTEAEVLNTIYSNLKQKYGDKKGSELYKVADRLVNPNENTIVEIRSNGVVVKEGDSYLLKPFTNTDANSKKWQLGRPLDVTEQFVDKKSEEDKEPKRQERNIDETKDTGLVDGINNIRSNEGAFNLFKVALGRGVIHESWYNDIGLELADLKKDKKGKVDTADVAEIIQKYSEREPKKKDDAKASEEQARINKEYETISEEIENIEDEKVEEVVNNKIENKKAPKRIYYKGIYTDGDGNFEFVEAENAKPIKLFSVVDAFYTKESGIFVITDTNSGAQIASGKTLKAAIKEAEKVAKSAENLIDVSRRYAEKHGFTPAMKIENAAKLEQDVKNASVENESVEGVIDNMEENGDIQKECN